MEDIQIAEVIYHIRAQHENNLEMKKLEDKGSSGGEHVLSSSSHPMLQGLLKK